MQCFDFILPPSSLIPSRTRSSAELRARLCEGRGRTFKSCRVHQIFYGVAKLERHLTLIQAMRGFKSYLRSHADVAQREEALVLGTSK